MNNFTFRSLLQRENSEGASVELALVEGDNEIAIFAGGVGEYHVVVVNLAGDTEVTLVSEEFSSMRDAVVRVVQFLQAEYELA